MSEEVSLTSEATESLQQKFIEFLKTFRDSEGNFKYEYRIKEMIVNGRKSLAIDYEDLFKYDPKLFEELIDRPDEVIYAFSEGIKAVVREFDEDYAASVDRFIPRLSGLPVSVNLREISSKHINKLVLIEGILVKATPPKQKLFKATYIHVLPTGESHEFEWPPVPGVEVGDELGRPTYCPVCIREELVSDRFKGSGRGAFKLVVEKSKYRSWQKIVIQERPEEVPAGHIPRSIDAILTDDIVDIARPGDRVSVIGIVKLYKESRRSPQPVFNIYLDVNNVIVAQRFLEEVKLSKDDEELIRKLSKDPLIRRKIVASIAPTIYGLWDIKEAIALQLFSGVPKLAPDGTKIRGDVHVLIVGDPGTAKSQLLQYVARIAPRGLYTTGKGSSAAGLCVSGDTLIYTDSGLRRVKDVVEENLNTVKVLDGVVVSPVYSNLGIAVYDGGGDIRYSRVDYCYILWNDKLLTIETDLGLELTVTPETKIMVLDNGKILWKPANELSIGNYVVAVRYVPEPSKKFNILDLIPENAYIRISRDLTKKIVSMIVDVYGSLKDFAKVSGISFWDLYVLKRNSIIKLVKLKKLLSILGLSSELESIRVDSVGYRYSKGSIKWITIDVDQWFVRVLARFIAKGYVRPDSNGKLSYLIYFTDKVHDLINFIELFETFCKHQVRYKVIARSYGYLIVIHNKLLTQIFRLAGVPLFNEGSIGLNEVTSRLPNELLSMFIKELYTVCGGLHKGYLYFVVPTDLLAKQLSMMLRRFGVVAEVRKGFNAYEVRISDPKSLKNLETVLGSVVKGIKQLTTSMHDLSLSYLEVNDSLIAVRVKDISEIRGNNVYDLTVSDYHSFIANGYVVHNTAAVVKDKQTGEYFLEAGAMVLADGGMVCIDEIDKMRDEDRVAIHEAMEQGTVSIAKAGIVARLNARASVLAAGNPKYGRYIPSRPISENINLPVTILSRFDLIFTLRDVASVERDKSLVRYVLKSHERIEEVKPEIPPEILRKYIAFARKYVRPKLTKEAEMLIEQFYLEMRKRSIENPELPIAITTRQLEGLVRLAEAHARMALKHYVEAEDAAEAIRLVSVMLENVGLDIETGHIDIDVIMTGKPKSIRDKELIVKDVIRELKTAEGCAKVKDVVKEAVKRGIDEEFVERYLTNLRRTGEIYEVRSGCIDFVE